MKVGETPMRSTIWKILIDRKAWKQMVNILHQCLKTDDWSPMMKRRIKGKLPSGSVNWEFREHLLHLYASTISVVLPIIIHELNSIKKNNSSWLKTNLLVTLFSCAANWCDIRFMQSFSNIDLFAQLLTLIDWHREFLQTARTPETITTWQNQQS